MIGFKIFNCLWNDLIKTLQGMGSEGGGFGGVNIWAEKNMGGTGGSKRGPAQKWGVKKAIKRQIFPPKTTKYPKILSLLKSLKVFGIIQKFSKVFESLK